MFADIFLQHSLQMMTFVKGYLRYFLQKLAINADISPQWGHIQKILNQPNQIWLFPKIRSLAKRFFDIVFLPPSVFSLWATKKNRRPLDFHSKAKGKKKRKKFLGIFS
jgi:hypothetical protein